MIMRRLDSVMSRIALPTIALAGVVLISFFVISIGDATRDNNAYIRVTNCIISSPSESRTQTSIESCYQNVEKSLELKLERYDTSGYNQ